MSNDLKNIMINNTKDKLISTPCIPIKPEDYLLNILLGDNIKKNNLNCIFHNSLFPVLNAIKKNSSILYNTNDNNEIDTYFIEYLNTINKCLLSFNSFLLQVVYKYCVDNNKNYYNDTRGLNDIFNPSGNKNSIEDLFKFLVKEKICYANQFFSYVLYESLFRNQLCHGWHNFFYYLLQNNNQANPNWKYPTSNNKTGFLFDDTNNSLYNLRKDLKEKSVLNKPSINLQEYFTLSSFYEYGILEIPFNISLPHRKDYWINLEDFEPGSTFLYMYDLNGEKSKKPDGSYWTIDLLNEFSQKETNNEFMIYKLSLNNLINNIKITISDLLESNLIT